MRKSDHADEKKIEGMRDLLTRLKAFSCRLKAEIHTLLLAIRDPRTPWLARLVAGAVVAYAFSPIDLIPDFIPILGYVDDLLLLPLGIWIVIRLVPPEVIRDCRAHAEASAKTAVPMRWFAAAAILAFWLALVLTGVLWLSDGMNAE